MFSEHLKDRYLIAAILFSFIIVFIKKWDVGGNIDTIWYAAFSKNVAMSGNYFKFWVSKYLSEGNNVGDVRDHMPMTYWVVGTFMKIFGVSDFIARLYPLICSFFTNILIYKLGTYLKDRFFGLICLLSVALSHQYLKWSGQLKMEIPLTLFMVGIIYLLIRYIKERDPKLLYWCAPLFFFGIMTKGPIIFCIPLALFFWTLIYRDFTFFKSLHFWGALFLLVLIGSIMLLPSLYFDGQNVYSWFYEAKKSFGEGQVTFFPYFKILLAAAPLQILLLIPAYRISKKEGEERIIGFFVLLVLSLIIPLSFFKVKFDHYVYPAYPFLGLAAAPAFYSFFKKWDHQVVKVITVGSILFMMIKVSLPLKTGMDRTKENINLPIILKFDKKIKEKNVWFYGTWSDDMDIFQMYQLYGDIDLRSITNLKGFDLGNDYLVVNKIRMPLEMGNRVYTENDCLLENQKKCVISGEIKPTFKLDMKKLPHEIYIVH